MLKIYSTNVYEVENQEQLKEVMEFIRLTRKYIGDEEANKLSKELTNDFRREMGSKCVLGVVKDDEEELYIMEFPYPSTENKFFTMGKDENGLYISVDVEDAISDILGN